MFVSQAISYLIVYILIKSYQLILQCGKAVIFALLKSVNGKSQRYKGNQDKEIEQ